MEIWSSTTSAKIGKFDVVYRTPDTSGTLPAFPATHRPLRNTHGVLQSRDALDQSAN